MTTIENDIQLQLVYHWVMLAIVDCPSEFSYY